MSIQEKLNEETHTTNNAPVLRLPKEKAPSTPGNRIITRETDMERLLARAGIAADIDAAERKLPAGSKVKVRTKHGHKIEIERSLDGRTRYRVDGKRASRQKAEKLLAKDGKENPPKGQTESQYLAAEAEREKRRRIERENMLSRRNHLKSEMDYARGRQYHAESLEDHDTVDYWDDHGDRNREIINDIDRAL